MFDDNGYATNTNCVTEIMQPFDDDQNSEIKIEKPMCEIQLSDISIFKEMDGRTQTGGHAGTPGGPGGGHGRVPTAE